MSEQQAYDRLIPLILAQRDEDTKTQNVAAEDKVMDCHKLSILATEDRESLLKIGLNPEYIDSLEDRIGAYSIAYANYMVSQTNTNELKERFAVLEKEAHTLRRNILHTYNFALDGNEKALEIIKKISDGRSRNDLIYDFVPMQKVSEAFTEDLTRVDFDFTLIERAEELHNEMQDLLSKIQATPKEVSELRVIKNKAYTYLEEAVSQIRKHGQYVFWENEERLELYKSNYRKKNSKRRSNKDNNSNTDVDTPVIAD